MTRRYVTQGRILIAELKRRPMTYAQMLQQAIRTDPRMRGQLRLLTEGLGLHGANGKSRGCRSAS